MLTIACCLVVGLGLVLGLDLVCVVMHTYMFCRCHSPDGCSKVSASYSYRWRYSWDVLKALSLGAVQAYL